MKFSLQDGKYGGEAYVSTAEGKKERRMENLTERPTKPEYGEERCCERQEETFGSVKQCYIGVKPRNRLFVHYSWKTSVDELWVDLVVDGVPRNSQKIDRFEEGGCTRIFYNGLLCRRKCALLSSRSKFRCKCLEHH